MNCVSALSTERDTDSAFRQVLEKLDRGLGGESVDLCVLFSTMHHGDELGRISAALREQSKVRHVMGCTAEALVGEDREVEGSPGLALWALSAPDLSLQSLRLDELSGATLDEIESLQDPEKAALLLLGDPFSFRIEDLLKRLNQRAPGLRVVGGMASGSQVPRANQLVLDGAAYLDGAVAVLLRGGLTVRTVVSQGCRPIGRTLIVTRAENNVIRDLGRRPALEVLREMFQELSEDDQRRIQDGLHIGRVINEYQETFRRGDFLVRNVIGADESGAIQINELIRVGQTVQFHVRDAETADEDLRENLLLAREQAAGVSPPLGALLFTCNGRGTRLFDAPDHDVKLINEVFGSIPVAGFFAMGELGPIGGQNFLHGFTASVVLFERPA